MNDDFFEHPILDEQQMADLKIQPGEYPFTVIESKLKISQSGNSMILLKMQVFDARGKAHIMTDFLIALDIMSYKIKHFWESVGEPERYKTKNRVSDYENKSGYCRVAPQKNKQRGGLVENRIVDYILKEEEEILSRDNSLIEDDDIPF